MLPRGKTIVIFEVEFHVYFMFPKKKTERVREREKLFSHFRKIGEIGGNLTISIRKRKMKNEQSAISICMKIMASLDLGDQPLIISLLLHVHAPPRALLILN